MILVFAAFCIAAVKADIILGNNPAALCRSTGGTDTYCMWKYKMNIDPKKDPGYICGFEPPSGSRTPHHVAIFDGDGNPLYVWSHKGTPLSYGENTGLPLNDARMKSVSITAHYPYIIESVSPGEMRMTMRQCAGEPEYIPFINSLHNERITIPPGKAKVVVKASQRLTHGGEAKWFLVHAHNIGVKNRAIFKGGSVERSKRRSHLYALKRLSLSKKEIGPTLNVNTIQRKWIQRPSMDRRTRTRCVLYICLSWTKIPIKNSMEINYFKYNE